MLIIIKLIYPSFISKFIWSAAEISSTTMYGFVLTKASSSSLAITSKIRIFVSALTYIKLKIYPIRNQIYKWIIYEDFEISDE